MDQGGVFLPEKAREVAAALHACARDYDIHIYILTLPTLNVLPSRARGKLDRMMEAARSTWLEGRVGALLIFDYESGAASMGESEEARRIFSPISINLIFHDPRLQYTRKIRSSDQVERAATALIAHFSVLRIQTNEEARRRGAKQKVFGGIAGGGLLLVIGIAFAKTRFPAPRVQSLRESADETDG